MRTYGYRYLVAQDFAVGDEGTGVQVLTQRHQFVSPGERAHADGCRPLHHNKELPSGESTYDARSVFESLFKM